MKKNSESEEANARSGVVSGVSASSETPASTSGLGITPGTLLDGKYLIGRLVGSGAFGLVFEGKNLELDEKVAIKTLRPEMAVDSAMVARFAREAKSAAAIKSEYVCSVYDVGMSPENVPYIVMEYLEGRDLGTVLAESGALGPRTAVEYALQVCEALAVAHAKGIVHRDIKPENLLLTERAGGIRIIKVLDFGISKTALTGSIFGEEMPIVKTINLMGTPLYMSPEQVRSSGGVDVRSDIWSLGMVLYEILASATAFEGSSITEICAAILEAKPKPIELHRADLPSGLVEVIAKCLEKDVKLRYQNVAELALALMPFGPKRSRLNVERAVTVLQSAGQADPSLQVDSVMPPPSSELSPSSPLMPRLSSPKVPEISASGADAPSSASPVVGAVSADDPRASGVIAPPAKKKPVVILAGLAVVAGLVGAVVFLSGALGSKPAANTETTNTTATSPATSREAPQAAATPATTPESPGTGAASATTTATATATTTTTTEPATTKAATPAARPTPANPNWGAHRPKAGGAAAVAPPTTTAAPPPATPQPPTAAPPAATPTETGRTFRREL